MPQPPALRLQRRERTLHVVLRASPHAATSGEREPVASVEAKRNGDAEQAHGDEARTHAGGPQAKQRSAGGPDPGFAGAREPAILLATRVVHASTASSSQPAPSLRVPALAGLVRDWTGLPAVSAAFAGVC